MYECHVTFETSNPDHLEVLKSFNTWKYSEFDGDPVMGPGRRNFLTRHGQSQDEMFRAMDVLCESLPVDIEVKRKKIELIVYDTKLRITE